MKFKLSLCCSKILIILSGLGSCIFYMNDVVALPEKSAFKSYENIKKTSNLIPDSQNKGILYYNLAVEAFKIGNKTEAIENFKKAIPLLEKSNNGVASLRDDIQAGIVR